MAAPTTQNTEYLYPSTWTNLTDTAANYASGFPEWTNDVYSNWYNQPLSTGVTPYQQQAYDVMMNPSGQWTQGIQQAQQAATQAQPYMQQAAGLYGQNAQYDPTQMQQFLNPYTVDANNATVDQVNRNLFENILPGVNSTFTGAGQFGSTRNADFMNRAVRDTQTGLAETLAKQNVSNYQNANQNYLNWAQQGNQSAGGLAGLGGSQMNYATTLANLAGSGANLSQQDITNMMTAAQNQQQTQQTSLDKNYQDWLTQQQFPISGLSAVSTAMGNMAKGVEPNVSLPVGQADDVSKVLAVIQGISSGLNDTSIQSIINTLFPDGGLTLGD